MDEPGRNEAVIGYIGQSTYSVAVPNSSSNLQEELAENVPAKQKRKGDVSNQSGYKVYFYNRSEAKKVKDWVEGSHRIIWNTLWGGKDFKFSSKKVLAAGINIDADLDATYAKIMASLDKQLQSKNRLLGRPSESEAMSNFLYMLGYDTHSLNDLEVEIIISIYFEGNKYTAIVSTSRADLGSLPNERTFKGRGRLNVDAISKEIGAVLGEKG